MSKLNRREFKELLIEWNNNFINEKFNPNFKQKIKDITKKNNLKNEIAEFDIVHVNAKISDEWDEVRFKEFRDSSSDIYKKINKFRQPEVGYDHDMMYENTDYCRNEILNYLFKKGTITQEEVSRVNSLGKDKDIMIIFEVGDLEGFSSYDSDNTYNDIAYNLHDTFHMIFDFNQKSRTHILKDFMDTTQSEFFFIEKLGFEDLQVLIDYVNKKLSINQTEKYTQHNITLEDFFPSFMAFIYLYVFNNSVESLSLSDDFENLFSKPTVVKEIMLSFSEELKKYIDNIKLDNKKYIYINCA